MPRPNLLLTLQQASPTFFAPPPASSADITYASAHGCLDVLGALEAEGGGTLAQMVLPGQIAIAFQPRSDGLLRVKSSLISPPIGSPEVSLPFAELLDLPHADALRCIHTLSPGPSAWTTGILALLWLMRRQGAAPLKGASLLIESDLPMNAGQSTSTALLAALARAIAERYRLATDPLILAQWAASAEAIVGASHLPPPPASRGHLIDALTSLHPRSPKPSLLRYSAQPHRFVGTVPLPEDVRVFALDTGVRYSSTRSTLEEIRVAAAMGLRIIETIYRDLGQPHTPLHGYLTNVSPLLYRQYFRSLLPRRLRGNDFVRTYGPLPEDSIQLAPDDLDTPRLYRVRTAVDHIIAENEHAEQFLQTMEELADHPPPSSPAPRSPKAAAEYNLTLQRAGRLLLASHHSYRLRLELSCREADWLVDSLMETGPDHGVFGARITGCGGGGTVVALLDRSSAANDALLRTLKAYQHTFHLPLPIVEL